MQRSQKGFENVSHLRRNCYDLTVYFLALCELRKQVLFGFGLNAHEEKFDSKTGEKQTSHQSPSATGLRTHDLANSQTMSLTR